MIHYIRKRKVTHDSDAIISVTTLVELSLPQVYNCIDLHKDTLLIFKADVCWVAYFKDQILPVRQSAEIRSCMK